MFSQMIDQGILNHLQEIDHLLIDLNDIHNIRMQEQEAQLNVFIQEGYIRPLSEREGLFLITQNQLNNFYETLKVFNIRLDSVEEQIKVLKDNGQRFSQELHKQDYKISNLEKERQQLEKILQDYQNNSSKIDEEEHYEGVFKQHIEEVKKNLQNTKIQELQNQVAVLQNQLDERNKFISQIENNYNDQIQNDNQNQIEIEGQEVEIQDGKESGNQNLIQIYEKKIQLLYSQISFYKKIADESLGKIKTNVDIKMENFEKQLKKQQLLFAEDEDDQKGIIDIQFSNSRTLQIVELQKQVYFLEEERDKIHREFEDYKKQTENDLKEMKSHKIEVQEYKQKLEESLKQIKLKTTENLSKQQLHFEDFKSYVLKIELLSQQNENLQKQLKEEQNRVNKIKKSFEENQKKLENELNLKNEIIRRFDPNSDIYKEQQDQIQQQTVIIEQLRSNYQRVQGERHQIEQSLSDKIEKLTEENKILLSMCEQVPEQNVRVNPLSAIVNNENKEQIQQNVASNLFKQLYDYQKKKYQQLLLENQIILSENTHSKQEKNKLIEENNKINQRLRQLQLTQKYNKKINGSTTKKNPKSTLKDYEPLSEDIQNILTINKEYKSKIQQLQLEIVGLRQEIEQLRQIQDLEKSQSNSSSFEEIELKPEQQDITEKLLMIQALQQSNILKDLFKDN